MEGKNLVEIVIMQCLTKKWCNILNISKLSQFPRSIELNTLKKFHTDICHSKNIKTKNEAKDIMLASVTKLTKDIDSKINSNNVLLTNPDVYFKIYFNIILGKSIFNDNFIKDIVNKFDYSKKVLDILNELKPGAIAALDENQKELAINNAINNDIYEDLKFIITLSINREQLSKISMYLNCNNDKESIVNKIEEITETNIFQYVNVKELKNISKTFGLSPASKKEDIIKNIEAETVKYSNDIRNMNPNILNNFLSLVLLSDEALSSVATKAKIPLEQNKLSLLINLSKHSSTKIISKKTISKAIKEEVWQKYMGNVFSSKCYCCNECTITSTSFSAGHVLSEKEGGEVTVDNLRPICLNCNLKMGTEHMFTYAKRVFGRQLI